MPSVSTAIPSLIQGMSQQAPELRLPTQCDYQKNLVSHPTYGLGQRAGTDHIRVLPGVPVSDTVWYSWVGRDNVERYSLVIDGSSVRVFGLDGKEFSVVTTAEEVAYVLSDNPKKDITSVSLVDSTVIVNRRKVIRMASGVSDALTKIAIVTVRNGNYGQKYSVKVDGTETTKTTSTTDVTDLQTSKIAGDLATSLTGALTGFTVTHVAGESQFTVTKNDGTDFDISCTDSVGNSSMRVCYHQVEQFSDLPREAPAGYVARVLGNSGDSSDDYWVRYDPDRDDSTEGTRKGSWVECVAPETPLGLDAHTMPHVLERLQDDTLGTATGIPLGIYFRFRTATWNERVVGTSDTSPDPSFVGNTIDTAFVVQGRLGFAFKANVVLSRSADLFNFFRATVTQVVDDDPIDVVINLTQREDEPVINIRHVMSFAEQLLLVADRAQIIVPLDEPLTPSNFRPSKASSFEADPDCRPVSTSGAVMLPYSDGTFVGVREFFSYGPTAAKSDRIISDHIPRAMKGRPWQASVCPSERTLFVRTTDDATILYVYRWLDINDGRAQSAWGVWTFEGAEILGFGVIESTLYLVMNRPEGPTLESLEITPWAMTEEASRPIILDRKTPVGLARIRGRVSDPDSNPSTVPSGTSGGGSVVPPVDTPSSEWPSETSTEVDLVDEGGVGGPGPTIPDVTISITPADKPMDYGSDVSNYLIAAGSPDVGYESATGTTREFGSVLSYDVDSDTSIIELPWAPTGDTLLVRGDTLTELSWTLGDTTRRLVVKGDARGWPIYAGVSFEARYRFGQAVLIKQSQGGGAAVVRSGRLQIQEWVVTYSHAGPFTLEVFRDSRVSKMKRFAPRITGRAINNSPWAGTANIKVLSRAERTRVDIATRTHWPCWFVSAHWVGELTSDYYAQ